MGAFAGAIPSRIGAAKSLRPWIPASLNDPLALSAVLVAAEEEEAAPPLPMGNSEVAAHACISGQIESAKRKGIATVIRWLMHKFLISWKGLPIVMRSRWEAGAEDGPISGKVY